MLTFGRQNASEKNIEDADGHELSVQFFPISQNSLFPKLLLFLSLIPHFHPLSSPHHTHLPNPKWTFTPPPPLLFSATPLLPPTTSFTSPLPLRRKLPPQSPPPTSSTNPSSSGLPISSHHPITLPALEESLAMIAPPVSFLLQTPASSPLYLMIPVTIGKRESERF